MLKDILIKEIMVSPVITAHIQDPFSQVEEMFRQKGIRHLPVVDDEGILAGWITQRDLFRIVSPRVTEDGYQYDPAMLNGFILKGVMTKDPISLGPDDHLSKAVEIMARNKYGGIPIVDQNKKVVGIVTETDILKFVARHIMA